MNRCFFLTGFFFLLFAISSCDIVSPPKTLVTPAATTEELLQADQDFSIMAQHVGIRKAYEEYLADEGVLLRPDHSPLKDGDAITYLSTIMDEGYELSWEPSGATIAASGEMGFVYGIYELKAGDQVHQGTYVNIWKKNSSGQWRYVLNSSNPGISPNQ